MISAIKIRDETAVRDIEALFSIRRWHRRTTMMMNSLRLFTASLAFFCSILTPFGLDSALATSPQTCTDLFMAAAEPKQRTPMGSLIQVARSLNPLFAEHPLALKSLLFNSRGDYPEYFQQAISFLHEKDPSLLRLHAALKRYRSVSDLEPSSAHEPSFPATALAIAIKNGFDYQFSDTHLDAREIRDLFEAFDSSNIKQYHLFSYEGASENDLWGGIVKTPKLSLAGSVLQRPLASIIQGQLLAWYKPHPRAPSNTLERDSSAEYYPDKPISFKQASEMLESYVEKNSQVATARDSETAEVDEISLLGRGFVDEPIIFDVLPNEVIEIPEDKLSILEVILRKERNSRPAYLAANESLSKILREDQQKVLALGSSHKELANQLHSLLKERFKQKNVNGLVRFQEEDYLVLTHKTPRRIYSPFGDNFSWTQQNLVIHLRTGRLLQYSSGDIYMVAYYGFYGGAGKRLSPDSIVEFF